MVSWAWLLELLTVIVPVWGLGARQVVGYHGGVSPGALCRGMLSPRCSLGGSRLLLPPGEEAAALW